MKKYKENKKINKYNSALIAVVSLLFSHSTNAIESSKLSEIDIGQALEAQLSNNGEAVWLNDGQSKFFTIYSPVLIDTLKGGVILLHDTSSHPDSSDVMQPLRTRLPLHGWATLSIQLPRLTNPEQLQQRAANRINKAIEHLHAQGNSNLVLVGHGTGATLAAAYLSTIPNSGIQAFVGISFSTPNTENQEITTPKLLEAIPIPILDIYGSQDLEHVTRSASKRALTARKGSDNRLATKTFMRSSMVTNQSNNVQGYIIYRQIKVQGADHNFRGASNTLIKRTLGWLERHAKGVATSSRN